MFLFLELKDLLLRTTNHALRMAAELDTKFFEVAGYRCYRSRSDRNHSN